MSCFCGAALLLIVAMQLPWSDSERSEQRSAAELLRLYGVTGADFARYADPAVDADERDSILLRTLYHLPRITPAEWNAWRKHAPSLDQLANEADAHRASAVHLAGVCRRMQRHRVPQRLQESLEFREYFELEIASEAAPYPIQVFAREVPARWKSGDLEKPVEIDGIVLDTVTVGAEQRLVLAAPRVAWYPAATDAELGIGPAQLALAKQGVDLSRFDVARLHNGREFDNNDRELFYQILAALRTVNASRLAGARPFRLETVLTEPAPQQGQLIRLIGEVRRITPILVEDPDIRARYGIDRYYQIDATFQLDDRQIRIVSPGLPSSALYRDKFPFTFCAVQLPDSLLSALAAPPDATGERPLMNERAELSGYFLKLWPYSSDYLRALDDRQTHPSPLLLGSLRLAPVPPPPRDTPFGIGMAAAFALALLTGFALLWRMNHRDERRRNRQRAAKLPLP